MTDLQTSTLGRRTRGVRGKQIYPSRVNGDEQDDTTGLHPTANPQDNNSVTNGVAIDPVGGARAQWTRWPEIPASAGMTGSAGMTRSTGMTGPTGDDGADSPAGSAASGVALTRGPGSILEDGT